MYDAPQEKEKSRLKTSEGDDLLELPPEDLLMKASELHPVFHSHQPSICARQPSRSSKSLQVICMKIYYGVIGKQQSNAPFHLQEVKLERGLTSVILPTTRSPTSGLYLSDV